MTHSTIALFVATSLLAAGCCPGRHRLRDAPRAAYLAAVEKRLQGDGRGYYDGLLAVAHRYPDSRAGRRARAMLQSSDIYGVYMAGVAAAIAVPAFQKYVGRSRQSEPRERLLSLHLSEQVHRSQHGTWCPDAAACRLLPMTGTRYVYFIGPDYAIGGDDADDRAALIARGRPLLDEIGLIPRLDLEGYFVVAFGDPDGDDELDIWTLDEAGEPYHLRDDLGGDGERPLSL